MGRAANAAVRLAYVGAAALPAFALMLAGLAKLDDSFPTAQFFSKTLHQTFPWAVWSARLVGFAEVALGIAICAAINYWRLPALLGATLFAGFAGLLLNLLLTNASAATCGCFGAVMNQIEAWSLWSQLALDLALMSLLVLHVALPRRGGRLAYQTATCDSDRATSAVSQTT